MTDTNDIDQVVVELAERDQLDRRLMLEVGVILAPAWYAIMLGLASVLGLAVTLAWVGPRSKP